MPVISYKGRMVSFPDDYTPEQALNAASDQFQAPPTMDVVGALPSAVAGGFKKGAGGLVQAAGDLLRAPSISTAGREMGTEAEASMKEATPRDLSIPQQMLLSAGQSVGMGIPVVGGAILSRGRTLMGAGGAEAAAAVAPSIARRAVGTLSALTAGSEYADQRAAEVGGAKAALHAGIAGGIEFGTEMFGVNALLGDVAGPLRKALQFALRDLGGEQVATLGQGINAAVSRRPDITVGEYLKNEWPQEALVTLGATALAAPVQGGAISLGMKGARKLQERFTEPVETIVGESLGERGEAAQVPVAGAILPGEPDAIPRQIQTPGIPLTRTPTGGLEPEVTPAIDLPPDLIREQLAALTEDKPGFLHTAEDRIKIRALTKALQEHSLDESRPLITLSEAEAGDTVLPGDLIIAEDWRERTTRRHNRLQKLAAGAGTVGPTPTEVSPVVEETLPDMLQGLKMREEHFQPSTRGTVDALRLRAGMETVADLPIVHSTNPAHIGMTFAEAQGQTGDTVPIIGDMADVLMPVEQAQGMADVLLSWGRKYSPNTQFALLTKSPTSEGALSQMIGLPNNTVGIVLPRVADITTTLELMSHEFGHGMVLEEYKSAPEDLKHAILTDYMTKLFNSKTQTVEEFANGWYPPARAKEFMKGAKQLGYGKTAPAREALKAIGTRLKSPGYLGSFDEYMAEQTSRYMYAREGMTLEAKVFFQKVIAALKKFFTAHKGQFGADVNFTQWMDGLATRVQSPANPSSTKVANKLKARLRAEGVSEGIIKSLTDSIAGFDVDAATNILSAHPLTRPDPHFTSAVLEKLPKGPVLSRMVVENFIKNANIRKQEKQVFEEVLSLPEFQHPKFDRAMLVQEVQNRVLPLRMQHTSTFAKTGLWKRPDAKTANPDMIDQLFKLGTYAQSHVWSGDIYDSAANNHFEIADYFAHTRTSERLGVYHIMEIQSDLMSRIGAPVFTAQEIADAQVEIDRIASEMRPSIDDYQTGVISAADFGVVLQEYNARTLRYREIVKNAGLPPDMEARVKPFEKFWYERIIREEVKNAAQMGLKTIRVSTPETLAIIEMWPVKPGVTGSAKFGPQEGIFKRQATINKFVTNTYGGVEVIDEGGLTWVEVDVPVTAATDPVVAFALPFWTALANGQQQSGLTNGAPATQPHDLPRFNWLIGQGVGAFQMAKLNEHVPGAVEYRQALRDKMADKGQWLNPANEIAQEWNSDIPKTQAAKLSRLLLDEMEAADRATTPQQLAAAWQSQQVPDPANPGHYIFILDPLIAKKYGVDKKTQELYSKVRNMFARGLDEYEGLAIQEVSRGFTGTTAQLLTTVQEIQKDFADMRKTPYFPHPRNGQWAIRVRAKQAGTYAGKNVKDGEVLYLATFDTQAEQRAAFGKVVTDFKSGGIQAAVSPTYIPDVPYAFQGMPPSVMAAMKNRLNLTPAQLVEYGELVKDMSSGNSFIKHMKRSKGVEGYTEDALRGFVGYFLRFANHVSRAKAVPRLDHAVSLLKTHAKNLEENGQSATEANRLYEWYLDHQKYVLNPGNELSEVKAFVSLFFMGFNVSSAVINTLQVPNVTLPYLSERHGITRTLGTLMKAYKDIAQSLVNPKVFSSEEAQVFERGLNEYFIKESFATEMAQIRDGAALSRIAPISATRKSLNQANHYAMWAFQKAEEINRRVTVLATYRLERVPGPAGSLQEDAYHAARQAVEDTQGEYAPEARPKFMQGNKSVIFQFMSYSQNMVFQMLGGDQSWKRLLLTQLAVAGVMGLPFVENLNDIVKFLARSWLGEDFDAKFEARKYIKDMGQSPELILNGMSSNVAGFNLSGRLSLGDLIPGMQALGSNQKVNDAMSAAAGDVGGAGVSVLLNALRFAASDDPNLLKRMGLIAPTAIRNALKAVDASEKGAVTGSYGAVLEEMDQLELAGLGLGFQPKGLTHKYEQMGVQKESALFWTTRRSGLVRDWNHVRTERGSDREGLADVMTEIKKYNATAPDPRLIITGETLSSSVQSINQTKARTEAGLGPNPQTAIMSKKVSDVFAPTPPPAE